MLLDDERFKLSLFVVDDFGGLLWRYRRPKSVPLLIVFSSSDVEASIAVWAGKQQLAWERKETKVANSSKRRRLTYFDHMTLCAVYSV